MQDFLQNSVPRYFNLFITVRLQNHRKTECLEEFFFFFIYDIYIYVSKVFLFLLLFIFVDPYVKMSNSLSSPEYISIYIFIENGGMITFSTSDFSSINLPFIPVIDNALGCS